jgi:predicted small lipoprotein YifL
MSAIITSSPRKRGSSDSRMDSRFRGNDGWKKCVTLTAVALVAITLAGCGKKGPPGPPPGVPNTYPQNYPQQ